MPWAAASSMPLTASMASGRCSEPGEANSENQAVMCRRFLGKQTVPLFFGSLIGSGYDEYI